MFIKKLLLVIILTNISIKSFSSSDENNFFYLLSFISLNSAQADGCYSSCNYGSIEIVNVTGQSYQSFWTNFSQTSSVNNGTTTNYAIYDVAESVRHESDEDAEDLAEDEIDVETVEDFISGALIIKAEIYKVINNSTLYGLSSTDVQKLQSFVNKIETALDAGERYVAYAQLGLGVSQHVAGGEFYKAVSEMTAFLAGFAAEKYVKIPFLAQLLGMATSYVVETTLDFVIDVWMDEIDYMELEKERELLEVYPRSQYIYEEFDRRPCPTCSIP